jgi:hypothetical protein
MATRSIVMMILEKVDYDARGATETRYVSACSRTRWAELITHYARGCLEKRGFMAKGEGGKAKEN